MGDRLKKSAADPPNIFVSVVLDGMGVGDAPDAAAYSNSGSDTLGHVCALEHPHLPNLERFGLGRICTLEGVEAIPHPVAHFGRMTAMTAGKDSTTGHWELAGVVIKQPFPLYSECFPKDVIEAFCREGKVAGALGNRPESGKVIVDEFGEEHQRTGRPIVYTSGDSVFQIAAHVETISLEELYQLCKVTRDRVCVGEHAVGRVIARPFESMPRPRSGGELGDYRRLTHTRKDFSLKPPDRTVQEMLQVAGVRTVSLGKIASMFGGVGFDDSIKTKGNADGIAKTLKAIETATQSPTPTFIWANLVDFDELYGHRNNPKGFAQALEAFDQRLPELEAALPEGACLLLTADHGNDPTYPGTDHTRERVPVLYFRKGETNGHDLGTRATFADHAATVAAYFRLAYTGPGTSFG